MTKSNCAKFVLTLRPVALAVAAAIGSTAAFAEPILTVPFYRGADMSRYSDNYIELGIGLNNTNSFKAGEWTGVRKDNAFGIANFNWAKRDAREDRDYWHVFGSNLGLTTRRLGAEGGSQGRWGLTANFDQITRYQFDSARFIHSGLGSSVLTLPAGFAGIGTNPATSAAVSPFLNSFDVKQDRKILGLGGKMALAGGWGFTVDFREDHRDGTKLIGSVIGNSGGNPRAVILPYQIDDKTDQLDAKLSFTGEKGQLQLGYYWSGYRNSADSLTWQNPYTTIGGWAAAAGFPTGQGRLGLMPDNNFNQLKATGAYSFSRTTRFNGTVSYGWATQNESFLPYTVNPGLTVTTPLPRSSLDGRINTTLIDLALSMRPMQKLNLRGRYKFHEHNNKTPQAQYLYPAGDSQNQDATPVGSGRARVNLPIGTRENVIKLDADYHLGHHTLLRGAYDWKKVEYLRAGFDSRESTTNNALTGEIRRVASEFFTGGLRYTYDQRRGSDYNSMPPFRNSYDPTFVAASIFDNMPTLRQFLFNDFDKNNVRASGNFILSDAVSVQLLADWYKIDYKQLDCGPQSNDPQLIGLAFAAVCQGRTKDLGESYTIDGQWSPREGLSTYAFYTYSNHAYDQIGQSFSGGGVKVANATNPTRRWDAKLRYYDNTFGVGINFAPGDKRFDYGAQYVVSSSTGETDVATGAGLTGAAAASPVPDLKSKVNTFQLYAKWKYSKNLTWRFNIRHEKFRSADWAYDNAQPFTSSNVLLTGQVSPNYRATVIGVSVAIQDW